MISTILRGVIVRDDITVTAPPRIQVKTVLDVSQKIDRTTINGAENQI